MPRRSVERAAQLREVIHGRLLHELENNEHARDPGGWATGMTRERVAAHARCVTSDDHVTDCVPVLVTSAQAEDIKHDAGFLTEAHIHCIVNIENSKVLTFNEHERNMQNCEVDVSLYEPGWQPQRKLSKQETKALTSKPGAVICIHLNSPPTHFSAMVEVGASDLDAPVRELRYGCSSAGNGSIDISGDD